MTGTDTAATAALRDLLADAFTRLIEHADQITDGLTDPAALAMSAQQFRGVNGRRSTVDLPADLHKALKVTAAQHDTSVQALLLAAIHRTYPDLTT